MSMSQDFLYFGRQQKVKLAPSGGDARLVEVEKWTFNLADEKVLLEALPWSKPAILLENLDVADEGSVLVCPQVPATVPEAVKEEKKKKINSLPDSISQPLQKALPSQLSDDHLLEVYVSGMRSAIYKEGEALYRFKGVGNGISNSDLLSVFPIRIVGQDNLRTPLDPSSPDYESIKSLPIEIRGAMFNFTASREQAITSLINHHLRIQHIPVANEPAGYYKYKDIQVQNHGNTEKNILSLCCGLYRTHGDKRLASHLLWGLELLIPFIFDQECLTLHNPNIIISDPPPTPISHSSGPPSSPFAKLSLDIDDTHDISLPKEVPKQEISDPSSTPTSPSDPPSSSLASLSLDLHDHQDMSLLKETPKQDISSSSLPPAPMPSSWILDRFSMSRKTYMATNNEVEVLDTGFSALEGNTLLISLPEARIPAWSVVNHRENPLMPEGVDKEAWQRVWSEEWEKLRERLTGDSGSITIGDLIGLVYWSIGDQAGRAMRVMHEADINWGTFADLLGNHCNAHPNNFVVLMEGDAEEQMKACYDGQEVRKEENRLNFLGPLDFDLAFTKSTFIPDNIGNKDNQWNEMKQMEVNAMRLAMGGLNINSGVEGKAILPSLLLEPIRTSLRDTMVLSFSHSYEAPSNGQGPHQNLSSPNSIQSPSDSILPNQNDANSTEIMDNKAHDMFVKECEVQLKKYEKEVHSLIRLALILSEAIIA